MRVELVGFPEPACENPVEVLEGRAAELATQTQSDLDTPGGGHLPGVPRCGLGAALRRIHDRGVPKNDTIVKAVLKEAGSTGLIPESVIVRLVVAEQQFRGLAVGVQMVDAEIRMLCPDDTRSRLRKDGTSRVGLPAPGVAEP